MPTISIDPDAQPSAEAYEVIVQTEQVCARDGVELATDIYRPSLNSEVLDGPFPVLLQYKEYFYL